MRSRGKTNQGKTAGAETVSRSAETPKAKPVRQQPLRALQPLLFPQDKLYLLFGLIVAACLFSNGFSSNLVFDDHLAIGKNEDSKANGPVSIREVFQHDFWGHNLTEVSSNGSYRPFTILSFRIQHLLMGYNHSAVFLHLFNYVVAFLNACLVYYLARLYHGILHPTQVAATAKPSEASDKSGDGRKELKATQDPYTVPTLAMLLFIVHPVHVDAVTSIVGRCELLYCLFGLLALFAVHQYAIHTPVPSRADRAAHPPVQRARGFLGRATATLERYPTQYLVLMVLSLICSLLCKDSGVTFTAIFVVHSFLLWQWKMTTTRRFAQIAALSVFCALAYFRFRSVFVGDVDLAQSHLIRRTENPQYFVPKGIWHWLSIRWTIQMKNFELLFYPTKLCCEYSYNCIPHMDSLSDSRLPYYVAVTAGILFFLGFCTYQAVRKGRKLALLLLASLLYIAIPYAPVSHLFVRVGTFIAERCLYVPSIGVVLIYVLALSPSFADLKDFSLSPRKLKLWGLLTVVGVWFVISYQRNPAWYSQESLFRESIKTCPNSGKSHYQLAMALVNQEGDLSSESLDLFQRAIELDNEDLAPLYYLSVDQWQNKRNVKAAYAMARECTGSPFTITQCYPLYQQMRSVLFPNMTTYEQLQDEGMIIALPSQQAQRFRDAGLYSIESTKDFCRASSSLQIAMHHWNESGLFWQSDEARPLFGAVNFCNTAYWFCAAFEKCFLTPQEEDGMKEPVVKQRKLRRVMRDLRLASRKCATDWGAKGVLIGAPESKIATYENRLTEYVRLNLATKQLMSRIHSFITDDETARAAKITALQLVVDGFCDAATLMENSAAKQRVLKPFSGAVNQIEAVWMAGRGKWRIEIAQLWKEVKALHSDNPVEQAFFENSRKELLAAGKCSGHLSAVIV